MSIVKVVLVLSFTNTKLRNGIIPALVEWMTTQNAF
jgi:hypothetical protein